MDRAYEANPASVAPAPPNPPQLGYPTEGGTPTVPGAWWFYMITEELRAAIVAGGIVPSATQVNQLGSAISAIVATAQQGYATQAWVTAQGFATEAWVTAQGFATEAWVTAQGFATEAWVTSQNYATQAFASNASNLSGGTLAEARLPASFTVGGTIASGVFNATSDRRLKKNLRPIKRALERVSKLRGVTFQWRKDNTAGASIVAQELLAVLPEGVRGDKTLFVDPMAVIGLLVQAVNELQARVVKLEAR